MRNAKMVSCFGWCLLVTGLICLSVFAQEKRTFVAYSMKVAQARVEEAVRKGEDFRKKQPDLFYLGGITKPWAVVLDAKTGDWILVGERDPKSSVLTLDDWVVALRARFIHGDKDPGVTIDPRPCEVCLKKGKKESCRHDTRQDVRFFGGIENTHFGQVCYEADWLMKRIGLGLEKLPIEKLKTYYELSLEQHRRAGGGRMSMGSRFWFYPIVNRVNVLEDVVLLEKFQMGVFTEVIYAEVDGKPVVDVDKFEHYPSDGFSRSFSTALMPTITVGVLTTAGMTMRRPPLTVPKPWLSTRTSLRFTTITPWLGSSKRTITRRGRMRGGSGRQEESRILASSKPFARRRGGRSRWSSFYYGDAHEIKCLLFTIGEMDPDNFCPQFYCRVQQCFGADYRTKGSQT